MIATTRLNKLGRRHPATTSIEDRKIFKVWKGYFQKVLEKPIIQFRSIRSWSNYQLSQRFACLLDKSDEGIGGDRLEGLTLKGKLSHSKALDEG